jgi:hypothetical protein
MQNQEQQSVKFSEIANSEMEQISGGDKIIQIFNPYSFAAPYGFIGPGFGSGGGQQQQQQQQGGYGGGQGNGHGYGHYK